MKCCCQQQRQQQQDDEAAFMLEINEIREKQIFSRDKQKLQQLAINDLW